MRQMPTWSRTKPYTLPTRMSVEHSNAGLAVRYHRAHFHLKTPGYLDSSCCASGWSEGKLISATSSPSTILLLQSLLIASPPGSAPLFAAALWDSHRIDSSNLPSLLSSNLQYILMDHKVCLADFFLKAKLAYLSSSVLFWIINLVLCKSLSL